MRRLQTLYHAYERRSTDLSSSRKDRLAWAAETLGRAVTSFRDLTPAEGKSLIDALQASMGIAETAPAPRRPASFRAAQNAGTEGRADQLNAETTMLDGSEPIFSLILAQVRRLGWDNARLTAFLASRSGPNGGRATIRTLGDANRVYWALKRLGKPRRRAVEVHHEPCVV